MVIEIEISTRVHPTESASNVEKALENMFPSIEFTLSGGWAIGKSQNPRSLDHFKEILKLQRIRDTAHSILRRSISENQLIFYLNKQAAFMGKVNFSSECPMGPITVSITGENLTALIDDLSPRT